MLGGQHGAEQRDTLPVQHGLQRVVLVVVMAKHRAFEPRLPARRTAPRRPVDRHGQRRVPHGLDQVERRVRAMRIEPGGRIRAEVLVDQRNLVQRGKLARRRANREIDPCIAFEIDERVSGFDLDVQMRIDAAKRTETRNQPHRRKGRRRGQHERALVGRLRTHRVEPATQRQQRIVTRAKQPLAFFGQPHAARAALEQQHADAALERLDLVRHGRRRHGQLVRGSLERAEPCRRFEYT